MQPCLIFKMYCLVDLSNRSFQNIDDKKYVFVMQLPSTYVGWTIVRRWRKRGVKPDCSVSETMNVPCHLCVLIYCMVRLYVEDSIVTINANIDEQTIECGKRTLT